MLGGETAREKRRRAEAEAEQRQKEYEHLDRIRGSRPATSRKGDRGLRSSRGRAGASQGPMIEAMLEIIGPLVG
jgi:hypothetical protein